MDAIRKKWDAVYSPWFTKTIVAAIVFAGTYMTAGIGPLSMTTALISSAAAAMLCLWNPGGAAAVYIVVFSISTMHINAAMVGIIAIVILIYCAAGYASVALMAIAPVFFISSAIPDGMYWGMLAAAMYFTYRSRESWTSFIYPAYLTLLIVLFGCFGTASYLFPDGFTLIKNPASDIDAFIAGISFDPQSALVAENITEIIKLMVLIILAGCVIWLVFRNRWLREKLKNVDLCEGVMFLIAAVVLILLDLAVHFSLGIETGTTYGSTVLSTILAFLITRPFASDKVAETFITRSMLRHRKDAALDYIAVFPKATWDTPCVNEEIKAQIKAMDREKTPGVLIRRDSAVDATAVAELIARQYEAKIIRIDHAVFEKLHGEQKEISFKKIFIDAKEQAPAVICFNDAEKFFYPVTEASGEYAKRDHKSYLGVLEKYKGLSDISVVCITDEPDRIDEEILGEGKIEEQITYNAMENDAVPLVKEVDKEAEIKAERKKGRKVTAVALTIILLGAAGIYYYFFVYENQKYDISEAAPVETIAIGQVDMSNAWDEGGQIAIADQIASMMEASEATFFYLEGVPDGSSSIFTVYQTDEATFNELSVVEKGELLKRTTKSANTFFNWSSGSLPVTPLQNVNNNNIFGGGLDVGECAGQMDAYFGGLVVYYNDHELNLDCEGMTATKLAFAKEIDSEYFSSDPTYYCILEGVVVTKNAVGDISGVPFLAPMGNASYIKLTMAVDYWDKFYGCQTFTIEKVE